jgi:hypothetical protein
MKKRHYVYYLVGALLGWVGSFYLRNAPDFLKSKPGS